MASFGARLKQEREQRGITLDAVALSTKIGTRFLRALEDEHFDQLPGGIFNRGFVRAYARCVGIDEDQAIADYLAASGEAQPKKAEVIEPAQPPAPQTPVSKAIIPKAASPKREVSENKEEGEDSGATSSLPWVPIAGVLLVAVLVMAVWRFLSRDSSTGSTPAGSTQSGSAGMTAAPTSTSNSPPVPQSTGAQAAPVTPAATTGSAAAPPTPASFVVLIKASEDSWVSITADGKPFFEDTMEAFAEKSVEAHSEIVVKVGNLGGLDFWFNGAKLPLQGDEGEVKTLTFDSGGLRSPAPKPVPPDASSPSP